MSTLLYTPSALPEISRSLPLFAVAPPGELCLPLPDLRQRLRLIMFTLEQTSEPCTPSYWRKTCGCGSKVVRTGCMNANCPNCTEKVTKRRAVRSLRRIDSVRNGRPLIYTVFTIPPILREKYTDRKALGELSRKVWKLLKKNYRGEFALSAAHPHGDAKPGEARPELFHPHINLCWLQKRGSSAFLDVDALRAQYREILGLPEDSPVDLQTQYHTQPEKIFHVIKYAVRNFPGFAKWCGSIRWLGSYPRKMKDDDRADVCKKCGNIYLVERSNVLDWQEYQRQLVREKYESPPGMDLVPVFRNGEGSERRNEKGGDV